MGSFINLAILGAVTSCIFVSSSAIVCESHLRFVSHSDSGSGSFADEICSTWALKMSRLMSWIFQEEFPPETFSKRTEGLFVFGVAFPFFLASTVVYVLSLIQKNKRKDKNKPAESKRMGPKLSPGDPLIDWWSFLVLFLPTLLICVDVLLNPPDSQFYKDMSVLMRSALLLANPFGVAACISLSFFLVPVARGSYTIEWETDSNGFGWSWSPMHALVFHRWAGWSGALFTFLHAAIFCVFYVVTGMQHSHQSPLRILWSSLVPGRECWPSWLPWSPSHSSDSFLECIHGHKLSRESVNITMEDCLKAEHHLEETAHNQCYGHWRNFMGTISTLSFMILCLTSLSYIRRRYYSIFYKTHIVAGSMMLIFAILHFSTILMYIFPSMVYYLATTIPTLIQQCRSFKNDGVRIKAIESVEDSGGCVEVTMPISSLEHPCFPDDTRSTSTATNLSSLSTPVYARVCVPSISCIWHPFSVMIKPKNTKNDGFATRSIDGTSSGTSESLTSDEEESPNTDPLLMSSVAEERDNHSEHARIDDYEVVIFFRSIGPFTKAWAKSLLSTMKPENGESDNDVPKTLLLDGFYPGAFPIPKIMQRHDAIFLVAGGVGIVPFVSVLQAWYHCRKREYKQDQHQEGQEQEVQDTHRSPQKIVLYWSCREPGLLNHFLENHLGFLLRDDRGYSTFDSNSSNIPSIELFCHLTRGGLTNLPTLPSSEQTTLQQPLLSEQEDEEGGVPSVSGTSYSLSHKLSSSSLSSSSDISSPSHQDLSTTESKILSGSIRVSRFDWLSFIVFALILWFSFLVQAWQYSRRILSSQTISIRFNSIYLTLVWSVLVALCGECFRAWYCQRHVVQQSIEDDNHRIEEERISINTYSDSGDSLLPNSTVSGTANSNGGQRRGMAAPSFVHRSALSGIVSVHIVSGRPDFQDMIDPIGECESPAVLLCGPEKLRESVRRAVQGDRKCSRKCSMYEEVSEM